MKIVGEQLQDWAQMQKQKSLTDVFGRSAYNRFYYAAFLITREMLGELDPRWKNEKHKGIPNLLVTGVKKPVVSVLKLNLKKGLITKSERSVALTNLNTSTSELSNLLTKAYDLRVIADYEPEEPISVENKILMLRKYKLNTAREWPGKASAFCKTIRKVWRDSGLV